MGTVSAGLVFLAGLGLGAIGGASLVVVVAGVLAPDDEAPPADLCDRCRKAGL